MASRVGLRRAERAGRDREAGRLVEEVEPRGVSALLRDVVLVGAVQPPDHGDDHDHDRDLESPTR